MRFLKFILPVFMLMLALPQADAQRGGRQDGRSDRPSSNSSRTKPSDRNKNVDFRDRLWYGAGGVLGISGNQLINFAAIGIIPQVGYKFNDVLSAGPRVGLTWNTVKGETSQGNRQRSNTWSYTGGLFARARIFDFYAQTEGVYLSDGFTFQDFQGRLAIDRDTGKPLTGRDNDFQWLVGAGYNAGLGQGISSDIGVFYNIFDNVESSRSPFSFRVTLTYNY